MEKDRTCDDGTPLQSHALGYMYMWHNPYSIFLSSSAAQPAFFNISQQLSTFSFILFYWLRLGRSTRGTTHLQESISGKSYIYSRRYGGIMALI